jgi:hypothetical protein
MDTESVEQKANKIAVCRACGIVFGIGTKRSCNRISMRRFGLIARDLNDRMMLM